MKLRLLPLSVLGLTLGLAIFLIGVTKSGFGSGVGFSRVLGGVLAVSGIFQLAQALRGEWHDVSSCR